MLVGQECYACRLQKATGTELLLFFFFFFLLFGMISECARKLDGLSPLKDCASRLSSHEGVRGSCTARASCILRLPAWFRIIRTQPYQVAEIMNLTKSIPSLQTMNQLILVNNNLLVDSHSESAAAAAAHRRVLNGIDPTRCVNRDPSTIRFDLSSGWSLRTPSPCAVVTIMHRHDGCVFNVHPCGSRSSDLSVVHPPRAVRATYYLPTVVVNDWGVVHPGRRGPFIQRKCIPDGWVH